MFLPRRWSSQAWPPIAGGLMWLWYAASFGFPGFLFALIPGCVLLSSGVSTLLYPGDRRIPQFTALGGITGVLFAIAAAALASVWLGLALAIVSAMAFVAAGSISVQQEPHTDEVPAPEPCVGLATQVAIDELLLATIALRYPVVMVREQDRVRCDVDAARELFRDRGWLEDPESYHVNPPRLTDPAVRRCRSLGIDYERLEFESLYEPHPGEPGRARWLSQVANRTVPVWVLRHRSEPRPWLVCIHGFQMGFPAADFAAFHARRFYLRYGMNLALPVLPLHGPRRAGRQSGAGFLSGDFVDTVHAEAQAIWDIRRLLSWIRAQGEPPIGVHGLSLGGYNAALLTSFEELACAIPGIPAVDLTSLAWRHGAPLDIRYAERHGLAHDTVGELLSVVSPLSFTPRVPREQRYIFAAVSDRLVPAAQVRDLWLHWDRPRIVWYHGAHVTFRAHPEVDRLIEDGLRESGLIVAPPAR